MTELDIQRRLLVDQYRRNRCCPNYRPRDWFECDVCAITKGGFFNEFEIKISLNDFHNDARKNGAQCWRDGCWQIGGNKHRRLAAGDVKGPKRFWFVAPKGIIPHEELPTFAGLIEASEWNGHNPPWNVHLRRVVEAPTLHNTPADPRILQHMESVFYYRFHGIYSQAGWLPDEVLNRLGMSDLGRLADQPQPYVEGETNEIPFNVSGKPGRP